MHSISCGWKSLGLKPALSIRCGGGENTLSPAKTHTSTHALPSEDILRQGGDTFSRSANKKKRSVPSCEREKASKEMCGETEMSTLSYKKLSSVNGDSNPSPLRLSLKKEQKKNKTEAFSFFKLCQINPTTLAHRPTDNFLLI